MLWLFEETVALYPSIYFYRKPQDDKDLTIERNCVFAKIEMARQYVNKFPQRFIPVYVFAKQEYNEYKQDIKFYTAVCILLVTFKFKKLKNWQLKYKLWTVLISDLSFLSLLLRIWRLLNFRQMLINNN